jgi:hypothetical protein
VSELDVLGRLPYGCIGVFVTLDKLRPPTKGRKCQYLMVYQITIRAGPNGIAVLHQNHQETERCSHVYKERLNELER